MIIAVSGPPGSGKTSASKRLSEILSFKFVSGGMMFRKVAAERGMDVIELNHVAEKTKEIDTLIDKKLLEEALSCGNCIIESHLSGWILQGVSDYSVFLTAPIDVRAKRISKRDSIPVDIALTEIALREYSHYTRFWNYYGIDIKDMSPYDLVINTSKMELEAVVKVMLDGVTSFLSVKNRA